MALSLTPQQAEAMIRDVESHRDRAVTTLQRIKGIQGEMVSSNWQGNSAKQYNATSAGENDDFDDVIQKLNYVVEKGSEHMRSVAANS